MLHPCTNAEKLETLIVVIIMMLAIICTLFNDLHKFRLNANTCNCARFPAGSYGSNELACNRPALLNLVNYFNIISLYGSSCTTVCIHYMPRRMLIHRQVRLFSKRVTADFFPELWQLEIKLRKSCSCYS